MTGKEAAQAYGTTIAMIRYYARAGLIPSPEKRNGKVRQYDERECDTIALIESMSAAGMALDEIAEYLSMREDGTNTRHNRMRILDERRARLDEKAHRLKQMIDRIDREMQS